MQREGGPVKRAVFLATAALLAMLILAPMALAQGTTFVDFGTNFGTTVVGDGIPAGSPSPPLTPETGGSAILLPAAALLLGSGILTYAFLRRR
jgi:hypothetical protein